MDFSNLNELSEKSTKTLPSAQQIPNLQWCGEHFRPSPTEKGLARALSLCKWHQRASCFLFWVRIFCCLPVSKLVGLKDAWVWWRVIKFNFALIQFQEPFGAFSSSSLYRLNKQLLSRRALRFTFSRFSLQSPSMMAIKFTWTFSLLVHFNPRRTEE